MTPPSWVRRSQVQRCQARGSASCALLWEAFCPSSSSQTCVFVEVAEARSRARRVRDGWGRVQAQDATAGTDGIREISDKARSKSCDVETTSLCSSWCAGFATREVQSEASARLRRPPPQSSPVRVRRETRPTAEPPPVLVVENPRTARDSTRKQDTTPDEKMEESTSEVKSAATKPVGGDGGGPTNNT